MSQQDEKDGICNVLMYTLFPSSSIGIQYEIKKINMDIDKLYGDLRKEREAFAVDMRMYRKLKNTKIPMDPNGMSRKDAIKSVLLKLNHSKDRIKKIEVQIHAFTKCRNDLESSSFTTSMDQTIEGLKQRMKRVKNIDAEKMVRNLDEIADVNKDIQEVNDRVSDAMISGWEADMDVNEIELEEYMATFDEEDMELGTGVEDEIDIAEEEKNLVIEDYEEDSDNDVFLEQKPVSKPAPVRIAQALF